MAFAFLWGGSEGDARLEDDEIALGEPDEAEKMSHPLHVEKDAKRFRVMMRKLYNLARRDNINSALLAAILTWLVISSPQFASLMNLLR